MRLPNTPGIYIILNMMTGKYYLGSALRLRERWNIHQCDLRKGKHHSRKLQSSWNKHGADVFKFIVVRHVDATQLRVLEQRYLDKYQPHVHGYNMNENANHVTVTPEMRIATIARNKARVWTADAVQGIVISNKTKEWTPEARAAIAATGRANKGKTRSIAARKKMAESARRRYAKVGA